MIKLKLTPDDFIPLDGKCNVIRITKVNLENNIKLIESSIERFNEEIEWDEMYDIEEAIKRIQNNNILYIGINDLEVIGHVWFNAYMDGKLLYNLFVRNKIDHKPCTGKEFVSFVIATYEINKSIYCEVDDWNEKSLRLFNKLGFKPL